MECLTDPEEKIMCPYNPAHFIRRCKMNGHLVKCKKNYASSMNLVECDFNATHRIPETELQHHHLNCPDRENIEITLYEEQGSDLNRFPIKPVTPVADGFEENWDNTNVISYNPKEHLEHKNVIRHLDVAPPSERLQFRLNERRRLSELEQQEKARKNHISAQPQPRSLPHTEMESVKKQEFSEKTKEEDNLAPTTSNDGFILPKSRKRSKKLAPNVEPVICPPQTEVTPDSILKILERIKIDANCTATQHKQISDKNMEHNNM